MKYNIELKTFGNCKGTLHIYIDGKKDSPPIDVSNFNVFGKYRGKEIKLRIKMGREEIGTAIKIKNVHSKK